MKSDISVCISITLKKPFPFCYSPDEIVSVRISSISESGAHDYAMWEMSNW